MELNQEANFSFGASTQMMHRCGLWNDVNYGILQAFEDKKGFFSPGTFPSYLHTPRRDHCTYMARRRWGKVHYRLCSNQGNISERRKITHLNVNTSYSIVYFENRTTTRDFRVFKVTAVLRYFK